MAGLARMLEVWPACLVGGRASPWSQFLTSNFHGPWLVDICERAGLDRCVAPAAEILAAPQTSGASKDEACRRAAPARPTRRSRLRAWSPWMILSVFVFIWGIPSIKNCLNGFYAATVRACPRCIKP